MKSLSPSTKNNMMTCAIVLLVVGLILWMAFKPSQSKSCPKSKIVVPIGNGQSVALTKEQFQKLKETYGRREGFYVSSSDYIPNVQTENEYTPMLSLYKPKEPTRVVPEPTPGPIADMPVPIPDIAINGSMTGATGATGTYEGYGNIFVDNVDIPSVDPNMEKYRRELTGLSPFFLNNGRVLNGEAI